MRASSAASTRVAPWRRRAASAIASRVGTPTIGLPVPSASPCATPQAMRSPVNDPGPAPKANPSSSASAMPSSVSSSCTIGRSSSEWRCPASSTRSRHDAPSPRATVHCSVEASSAMIRMGRDSTVERDLETVVVTALDHEGRGIARRDGKVVFVDGALIGERVAIETLRTKQKFDLARAAAIEVASPARVAPPCPYFGTCGGCSLQHLDPAAQVAVKQRVLEDALWHIGKVRAGQLLAPIHGVPWGYRQRARFSVRDVPRKGGVLVGFHERKSSFVADMKSCLVVPPRISALIPELRRLIERLSIRDRVPQIELAIGGGASESGPVDALVLRVLAPPTDQDL